MARAVAPSRSTAVRGGDHTARLEDILKANGEEYLYDHIRRLAVHAKDAPPVIFKWQNVDGFVCAIQAGRARASEPGNEPLPVDPLGLPVAVNVLALKEAVLEYARTPGAPARLGTMCLPCSLAQLGQVTFMLRNLDLDPWTQRVLAVGRPNSLPIASVYVPRPRSNTLDRVTLQFAKSLWG